MLPTRKLNCLQCLERLQRRIEKRISALERTRLIGNEPVLAELRVELDFLRRALRYLRE
jgi:hypothetical protein